MLLTVPNSHFNLKQFFLSDLGSRSTITLTKWMLLWALVKQMRFWKIYKALWRSVKVGKVGLNLSEYRHHCIPLWCFEYVKSFQSLSISIVYLARSFWAYLVFTWLTSFCVESHKSKVVITCHVPKIFAFFFNCIDLF